MLRHPGWRGSLLAVLALAPLGCEETPDASAVAPDPELGRDRAGPGALPVLTWNVYYGADLGVLLADDPTPLPVRVAGVFGQVQATRAADRAAAMADLIAGAPPALIGLQEVARYRTQSPGDFLDASGGVQNPVPDAADEVFDFVALLLDALSDRGLGYVEASRTTTFDVELPMFAGGACPPCDDLRLTESVAILAREDVRTSNPGGATFDGNLPVSVQGLDLEIVKGWASVDVTVKGLPYRFVTTHLEPADVGPGGAVVPDLERIQLAQAAELLGVLEGVGGRVVLAGDLNTEPGGTSTATYALLRDAGFVDTWLVGRPRGPGHTANQDADLRNRASELFHRIDFVLYRDDFTVRQGRFRGSVRAELLGEDPQDRTATDPPLWPSDHAGVRARLSPPQGPPR